MPPIADASKPPAARTQAQFDRVAGIYRPLEYLAFGRTLEHARFQHLPALANCRNILVVGDGDGRCVARLAQLAPQASIECVDTSARMLDQLERRLDTATRARVTIRQADIRDTAYAPHTWDAVVTMFVLDCLTADEVAGVVRRIAASLRPGGLWLWADFAIPDRGWRRLRAQAWVAILYAFFRWQTGLPVAKLPPAETILAQAGLRPSAEVSLQQGLVRSVLFQAPI